jgi:hypothetical protein
VSLARTDRANQIALVDVGTGSARVLKTMDWRSPQKLALSPDGRYVAFDFPQSEDSHQRDVFLLAIGGSREELLVEHPDNDVVLGWTPDGKRLLFGSDRTGRLGIWALPVADGKALGSPELQRPDVPLLRAMGVTPEGSFYYSVRTGVSDVYTATLDPHRRRDFPAGAPHATIRGLEPLAGLVGGRPLRVLRLAARRSAPVGGRDGWNDRRAFARERRGAGNRSAASDHGYPGSLVSRWAQVPGSRQEGHRHGLLRGERRDG